MMCMWSYIIHLFKAHSMKFAIKPNWSGIDFTRVLWYRATYVVTGKFCYLLKTAVQLKHTNWHAVFGEYACYLLKMALVNAQPTYILDIQLCNPCYTRRYQCGKHTLHVTWGVLTLTSSWTSQIIIDMIVLTSWVKMSLKALPYLLL